MSITPQWSWKKGGKEENTDIHKSTYLVLTLEKPDRVTDFSEIENDEGELFSSSVTLFLWFGERNKGILELWDPIPPEDSKRNQLTLTERENLDKGTSF